MIRPRGGGSRLRNLHGERSSFLLRNFHIGSAAPTNSDSKALIKRYSLPQHGPWMPIWGIEVKLYSFFNLGAEVSWVINATPRPHYPRKRPGTHLTVDWVGPRAGLDMCVWKTSPSPRFDPRTVRPVASRYADWATGTTTSCGLFGNVGEFLLVCALFLPGHDNHQTILPKDQRFLATAGRSLLSLFVQGNVLFKS